MIKPKLHKVFSMLLAVLILLSAFSFSIETRLCSTMLSASVSNSNVKSCCSSSSKKFSKGVETSCCKSKVISVDGLNEVEVLSVLSELPTLTKFEGLLKSYSSVKFVDFQSSQSVSYPNYTPPDLVYEFQIEYQAFLI